MEKYGVEEEVPDKTAEETCIPRCPKCGATCIDPATCSGILLCPNCGSKPFESK